MFRILLLEPLQVALFGLAIAGALSCSQGPVSPSPDGGVGSCTNIVGDRRAQVCLRWRCDRADLSEGIWTGSLNLCRAGDNLAGRANALKLVNLQRFLAQLPEVVSDPARNEKAQQCALMMHANGQLSHTPPTDWTCYTAGGAEAASMSNLATTPGVEAVDLYMIDGRNLDTLGHRRWILSPDLGPVGLGSTFEYSCLWVIGGSGSAARPWVAWPPPGPFPLDAFTPRNAGSLNGTGWSIQSETIDLSSAIVRVSENGIDLPVATFHLQNGFGSEFAIRFTPSGWAPLPGRRYDVRVTGVAPEISYSVEVVECI
jgi:hypothetical protein